jgi:hypothetical protein
MLNSPDLKFLSLLINKYFPFSNTLKADRRALIISASNKSAIFIQVDVQQQLLFPQ